MKTSIGLGITTLAVAAALGACGGGSSGGSPPSGGGAAGDPPPVQSELVCDDTLKAQFKPDSNTSVVLVKSYKAGDPLVLSETATATTAKAASDICLVKLNVGPGTTGPQDASSTTPGIGLEVWLPLQTNWNGRIHNYGGGGLLGGNQGSAVLIGNRDTALAAGVEGAVAGSTDAGTARTLGDKFLLPDGTANKALWEDWSNRSLHELAVKTKALALGFYGQPHKYAYFFGWSGGGRQAGTLAQKFPNDYNGILIGQPALNMNGLIAGDMYPQIVVQRDLGGAYLSTAQMNLVTDAAVAACDVVGGQHLGYPIDPWACKYDPTTDASVLCTASGGANGTSACLTTVQATAVNKFWYGMTSDGSVPSPAVDNGGVSNKLSGVRRWWGIARGSSLSNQAGPNISLPYTSWMAATLQDPRVGPPEFTNATGTGQHSWTSWSYQELDYVRARMIALSTAFGGNDGSSTDLRAFRAAGGKMVGIHGLADPVLTAQSQASYYEDVASLIGGTTELQSFYKLYLVPGLGHSPGRGQGVRNANAPLGTTEQYYRLLTDWVEKGIAPPQRFEVSTDPQTGVLKTAPLCAYPLKRTYVHGDPNQAQSYSCS